MTKSTFNPKLAPEFGTKSSMADWSNETTGNPQKAAPKPSSAVTEADKRALAEAEVNGCPWDNVTLDDVVPAPSS